MVKVRSRKEVSYFFCDFFLRSDFTIRIFFLYNKSNTTRRTLKREKKKMKTTSHGRVERNDYHSSQRTNKKKREQGEGEGEGEGEDMRRGKTKRKKFRFLRFKTL